MADNTSFENLSFRQCWIAHRLLMDIQEEYPVSYTGFHDRLYRYGWSKDKAVTTPARKKTLVKREVKDTWFTKLSKGLQKLFISIFKQEYVSRCNKPE